jgi:hypothetical protein
MKKFIFIVFVALSVFAFVGTGRVFAGTEHNLAGYAWSSNIGWISFNCTNDSTCGTSDYGVNENPDGTLTGYAWSPNIGWVQFGGLSSFPSGSGTQATNAQLNGTNLKGWARAIAADNSDWDGWISLSGSQYGVNQANAGLTLTGYAWGSDVVGWVLFDIQNVYPSICSNCGVALTSDASLDVQIGGTSIVGNGVNGNTNYVTYNYSPNLVWTLTNVPSATCAVSKVSAGGTSFTTVNGITSTGSTSGGALTGTTTYTYAINCSNPTISHQVSFAVGGQPANFSMGGPESMVVKFVATSTADSELKTFFISSGGGFSSDVTVSLLSNTCPANTKYSLGGGSFATTPQSITVSGPYPKGSTFKARFAQQISSSCTVTLSGTGGSASDTKVYTIVPQGFTPSFKEF